MQITPQRKWSLCSLILIFMLTVTPLWAGDVGVVTCSTLNVRQGPAITSKIISKVHSGHVMTILETSGMWCKVQLSTGTQGWVHKDYLEIKAAPSQGENSVQRTLMVTGKVVNVRTGPGINYSVMSKIGLNEKHTIVAEKNGWYQIKIGTKLGWISGTLARVIAPVTTNENVSGSTPVNTPDLNPEALPLVEVTGNVVNIRKNGDITAPLVDKVTKGTRLVVTGTAGQWYEIQLGDGRKGWIAGWLVQPINVIPSRGQVSQGLLFGLAIAEDKNIKVMESAGRPCLILEGWEEHEIKMNTKDKMVYLDLAGTPIRNYEQQEPRVGLTGMKVAALAGKTRVDIALTFAASLKAQYNSSKKTMEIQFLGGEIAGLSGKLIVLDPGHASVQPGGWLDPGAIGPITKLYERDVNLAVSLKLKALLEAAGARVIMTHTSKTELSLTGRAQLANSHKADIFVSIHANSSDRHALSGHTTYFFAPADDAIIGRQRSQREKLAAAIQKGMVQECGRKDNGIMEARFVVLRDTLVPSVLVETAFLSDRQEEILLGTDAFRVQLAQGIFNGIRDYFQ